MKRVNLLLTGAIVLLMSSCRKDVYEELSEAESRVYITRYDSTANFASYTTFRIADSVRVIQNGQPIRRAYTAYDSSLLFSIRQAMIQRGYRLQTNTAIKPDIGINVARINNTYSGVVSYGNYWGDYLGYWDPYYWGYGGYGYNFPYSFSTYTVREGALSIDMLDLKNPLTSSNSLNTIWTGLGRGSGIFETANINETVQALFNQSPYLRQ